jgi:hypothetical protein
VSTESAFQRPAATQSSPNTGKTVWALTACTEIKKPNDLTEDVQNPSAEKVFEQ